MEIHNHGLKSQINFQANNPSRNAGNVDSAQAANGTNDVQPSRLIERLEGDAKVRERLLVEVKAKFQAGEYDTQTAIEKAANVIVD